MTESLNTKAFYAALVKDTSTPNVIGVGTGLDGPVVFVLDDAPEAVANYATRDTSVTFIKAGPFKAYEDRARYRPVPGGCSVGHYAITAGTHGGYFNTLSEPDKIFMLSNAHVLADENAGNPGDAIYQPGKYHGGGPADTVARLTKSIKLENTARNLVDAAIAEMIDLDDVDLNILGIGRVYGTIPTILGQDLYKRGSRSELTRGVCIAIDAIIEVGYENRTRIFEDCIVSTVYSAPGDSGSLICDYYNNYATSLLFAGGTGYTISCGFDNVMRLLELGIIPFDEVLRGLIVDVSHWQWPVSVEAFNTGANYAEVNIKANIAGLTPFSFAKMKSRGTYAVIAKAFQPPDIYDQAFGPYCDYAEQAEILKTAYGFCDPAYSWREHLEGLQRAIGTRKMDFSVMWDWEFTNGKSPQIITSLYQNLNKATEDWQGKRAINYSSPGWYDANILPFNATPEFPFNDYDLPFLVAYWSENALSPLMPKRYRDNNKQQIGWQVGPRPVGEAFGVSSKQIDLSRFYPGFKELIFSTEPPPPPDKATLTVSIVGQGAVSPGAGQYPKGQTIQLTATPADGWAFSDWSGAVISQANPLNLLMDADKSITATFTQPTGGPAVFEHYKGTTTVNLNYRKGPGTTNPILGTMPAGTMVEILEETAVGVDTWVRIGYKEWACQKLGRLPNPYIEYVMA